ncbi:hypothetical protein SAMN05216419_10036 [Nitrosomonas cryotolerans]|uniref:Uncharacterized protein n=1 Tax=Nitrosomonas cryotolerans ATCC 49181 TaxID=1131553 RepID=A0A1N6J9C6_9PROT|nr:hypothetical protein [Nitrosomonas cryotolerans]SFP43976.1 hypothetical protein SAMN05216419_10036 [Nitrosomonas cryotolerans]SIO40835.1 hypothetical protein SAMN02743940_2412 [Nitrosomonas cryotolerans ATCC 49181]
MGIIVNFKSGAKQIFIVHQDILATEFRHLAETVGGRINSVEFMSSPQYPDSVISESKGTF